jgi:serralysin
MQSFATTGNSLDHLLSGNSGNNSLTGGDGKDTLDGGRGIDSLTGGAGDDTYIVDSSTDLITEAADAGTDTVKARVSFSLAAIANVENLKLTGKANISGTGNSLDNLLSGNSGNNSLTGGDGKDTLDGGRGIDSLNGGAGDDTYIVDSSTDLITEAADAGTDTVTASVSFSLAAIANVENLTLTGKANINGTGNSLDNLISGNSGNNSLTGGDGKDTLTGGRGNDSLDGGAGADRLTGGSGTDTFRLAAFTDSLLRSSDVISDFAIGIDVLDGPTAVAAANISKLTTGNAFNAANLARALSSTNFIANGGSLLTFTNGTYLALNDNVAGWDAATDAVIRFNFTGNAADLSIA